MEDLSMLGKLRAMRAYLTPTKSDKEEPEDPYCRGLESGINICKEVALEQFDQMFPEVKRSVERHG